jgi:hypothetical protein
MRIIQIGIAVILHCRVAATVNAKREGERFEPVTMGHIRGHGVTRLLVYCESLWCNHSVTLEADWLPDIVINVTASSRRSTVVACRRCMPPHYSRLPAVCCPMASTLSSSGGRPQAMSIAFFAAKSPVISLRCRA